jgi:hypothetical protein
VETRCYNAPNRLKSIVTVLETDPTTTPIIVGFTCTPNAAGERMWVVEATGRTVKYTYDAVGPADERDDQ